MDEDDFGVGGTRKLDKVMEELHTRENKDNDILLEKNLIMLYLGEKDKFQSKFMHL